MRIALVIAALALGSLAGLRAQDLSFAAAAGAGAMGVAETSLVPGTDPAELVRKAGVLMVRGRVDGAAGWLVLDTGAPGLIVHDGGDASHESTGTLSGVSGVGAYAKTEVATLELGALRQRGVEALAVNLTHLRLATGLDVIGVVGYAQLAAAPVRIDLPGARFIVGEDVGYTDVESRIPLRLIGHVPSVRARVGDRALQLGFDTGSGVNVLDDDLLPALREHLRGRTATRTLAGITDDPIEVPCGLVRLSLVAEDEYRDRAFLFAPLDHLAAALPGLDGLLTPGFLGAVDFTLDYGRGAVTFHSAGDR